MFCQMCGSKIEDGQMFCPSCGAKVPDAVPTAAAPTPAEMMPEAPEPVAEVPVEAVEPEVEQVAEAAPEVPVEAAEPEAEMPLEGAAPVAEVPVETAEAVVPEEQPMTLNFGAPEVPQQQSFPGQEMPQQQGFPGQGMPQQQGFPGQGMPQQQGFPGQGMPQQQGYPNGFPNGIPGAVQQKKKFPIIPVIAAVFALVLVVCGTLTFGHFKYGWFVAYNQYQYGPNYSILTWYMEKTHSNIKPKDYEIVLDYHYNLLRYKDSSKQGGYGYVTTDSADISKQGDEDKYEPYDMTITDNYSTNGRIITELEDSDGDKLIVASDTNGRVLATYDEWYKTHTFYAYKSGRIGELIYVMNGVEDGVNEFSEYAYVNDRMSELDCYKHVFNYDSRGSIKSAYYGDEEKDDGHWIYEYSFTGDIESATYVSADEDDDESATVTYTVKDGKMTGATSDYTSGDDTSHTVKSYVYNEDGTTTVKLVEADE